MCQKFKDRIKEIEKYDFPVGEGEISGSVNVSEKEIYFSDGWNFIPEIQFKYCPECGEKTGHSFKENDKLNKLFQSGYEVKL